PLSGEAQPSPFGTRLGCASPLNGTTSALFFAPARASFELRHFMQPCISQVCSLASSFEDDIDGYAAAAGSSIELWLTKLEEYLATHRIEEVRSRTADRGLNLAAAAFQGGLLISQGEARRAAWEQFKRRLELCDRLGVPVLVVVADFLGPFSQTDIERARISLQQAGEAAAGHRARIALEVQAKNTV